MSDAGLFLVMCQWNFGPCIPSMDAGTFKRLFGCRTSPGNCLVWYAWGVAPKRVQHRCSALRQKMSVALMSYERVLRLGAHCIVQAPRLQWSMNSMGQSVGGHRTYKVHSCSQSLDVDACRDPCVSVCVLTVLLSPSAEQSCKCSAERV